MTSPAASTGCGGRFDVERKRVRKQDEERVFTHIHIQDRFPFELTIYSADKAHYIFKSSITGKPIERANISELETLLSREYPDVDINLAVADAANRLDRFQVYQSLLLPLDLSSALLLGAGRRARACLTSLLTNSSGLRSGA